MTQRNMALGQWARDSRRAAGFTSSERAAAEAGVPATWLRQVEAGYFQRPDPERIASLEALYGSRAPEYRVTPEAPEEERLAALLVEAYERGLREGLRIARGEG